MPFRTFEDLEVWKRALRLAVEVHQKLGETRNFVLKDQMCRASLSIPSNIAEGHERDSRQDFIRFLRIAKGSAAELRTQSYVARELGVLAIADCEHVAQETREIAAMIRALIPAEN